MVRSPRLTKLVFGVDCNPIATGEDYYFDVTTLVLIYKLTRELDRDTRVLDMGTGTAAILGLSLWKRRGCHVIASDVNPEIARLARAAVRKNGAPIRVVESRFFDAVDEDFDVVTFNPPYVPTGTGERRGLSERFRSQWDGGPDGDSIIAEFLREMGQLGRDDRDRQDGHPVRAYIGVNRMHVDRDQLVPLIDGTEGVTLVEVDHNRLLPVDVYVVATS